MILQTTSFIGLMVFAAIIPQQVSAEQDPEILAQEAASGADAANPTAAVNYQDLRYRYFDLSRGDKHSFETEGAYMFTPRLKFTNELRYVSTDRTGKTEQDFEELKLKGIYLTDIEPFGIKAKLAVGGEWLKNLGDFLVATHRSNRQTQALGASMVEMPRGLYIYNVQGSCLWA